MATAQLENSKPEAAEIVTDFSDYRNADKRRTHDVPLPDGRLVRIQSLTWGEERKCFKYTGETQFLAVVCLAVIDEHGDTQFDLTEKQLKDFDNWDARIVEALVEACKAFCLNVIDYEAMAKNSDPTRND